MLGQVSGKVSNVFACYSHQAHALLAIDMSYSEIILCSVIYQLALYFAIRMAHRCFTVGELSLMCFGGVALAMEMLNMTKARVSTKFIFIGTI